MHLLLFGVFELGCGGVSPSALPEDPAHQAEIALTWESSVSVKCADITLPRVSAISC